MSERKKRIVLSAFWVGDTVYHVADGSRGLVLYTSFEGAVLKPKYFCVFDDRKGEWCEEMELSSDKTFAPQPEGGEQSKA